MSWMTIIIAVFVAIVFLVANVLVRIQEGHDEDDQLYYEAQRKLKSEYYRSLRLSESLEAMKNDMDWHK